MSTFTDIYNNLSDSITSILNYLNTFAEMEEVEEKNIEYNKEIEHLNQLIDECENDKKTLKTDIESLFGINESEDQTKRTLSFLSGLNKDDIDDEWRIKLLENIKNKVDKDKSEVIQKYEEKLRTIEQYKKNQYNLLRTIKLKDAKIKEYYGNLMKCRAEKRKLQDELNKRENVIRQNTEHYRELMVEYNTFLGTTTQYVNILKKIKNTLFNKPDDIAKLKNLKYFFTMNTLLNKLSEEGSEEEGSEEARSEEARSEEERSEEARGEEERSEEEGSEEAIILNFVVRDENPTESNCDTEGYSVGNVWVNSTNNQEYICLDPNTGAAVWKLIPQNAKEKKDGRHAPTVNDDDTKGYSFGSIWVDVSKNKNYICLDASTGAAVWKNVIYSPE